MLFGAGRTFGSRLLCNLVKVPMQSVDLGKQDALITHPSLPSDARENWPARIVVVFVSFVIMRIQSK